MNNNQRLSRFLPLVGEEAVYTLKKAKICMIGLGGVGGQTCLALARCGVEDFTLIDGDVVNESNINRQAVAFTSTLGRLKTHVMRDMILDINPDANVNNIDEFVLKDEVDKVIDASYDIVIDAIDDVGAKLSIIKYCYDNDIKCISALGAGNRLNPVKLQIADISKTYNDPLAKKIRYELKKLGVKKHKVVFSEELPVVKGGVIYSAVYVTASAGLLLAKAAVDEIINDKVK